MPLSETDLDTIVTQMPIPDPWDREIFVEQVSALRGRPIRLIPVDTATIIDSPCGLWLSRDNDDLLLYAAGTSDYHIDQIVCHEVGHMILGHDQMLSHRADRDDTTGVCGSLLPDLDPETVNAVLARGEFSNDQEHEAETFASLLLVATAESPDTPFTEVRRRTPSRRGRLAALAGIALAGDPTSRAWRALQPLREDLAAVVPPTTPICDSPSRRKSTMELHQTDVAIRDSILQLRPYFRDVDPEQMAQCHRSEFIEPDQIPCVKMALQLAEALASRAAGEPPAQTPAISLLAMRRLADLEDDTAQMRRLVRWWPLVTEVVKKRRGRIDGAVV